MEIEYTTDYLKFLLTFVKYWNDDKMTIVWYNTDVNAGVVYIFENIKDNIRILLFCTENSTLCLKRVLSKLNK